jgi:uncharacterized protein
MRTEAITEYVLKVHSRCDLRCNHCYVYTHRDQTWRARPRAISRPIAHLAAQRIAEHARTHRLHRVRIVLHGGEPLLLGSNSLRDLLTDLRATLAPATEVDLVLQSNGVLLTEELCQLFVEHGVRVGISLDGDAAANDLHRRFGDGTSSHAAVLRALELLRRPEFRPAYGGILCTIDLANDPLAVYTALVAQRPPRIDFLLPHATWDAPPPGSASSHTPYAAWLLSIYRRWLADGRPVPVRLFDSLRSTAVGGPSQTEAVGLGPTGLVVIETDGAWEQPDSMKTTFHGAADTGFDIRTHSLDDVVAHTGTAIRRQGISDLCQTCRECPVVAECGGGLRAHRYSSGGFDNPSVYCADLKELILSMRQQPDTGSSGSIVGSGVALDALLDDLAAGPGSADAVRLLMDARRATDRALLVSDIGTLPMPGPVADAWALLKRLDEAAPAAIEPVWHHPWIRVWALRCIADAPELYDIDYLALLAGAAAILAGIHAELRVPVRDGFVHLPGLGSAATDSGVSHATLLVTPDSFVVRAAGAVVSVVGHAGAPGWLPARRVGPDDWPVLLDDLDGYRDCHEWPTTDRLDTAAARDWHARLSGAWAVLATEAPDYQPALRTAVHTVIPLRDEPEGRSRSATQRNAFAAVGLSATDVPSTAVLLVHELQHVKLGVVLDLCDLSDPDNLATVGVPWRPDPRPIDSALQGIYAHLGVADIWRRRAGSAAASNYRRYHRWVGEAMDAVSATRALTPEGQRLVAGMRATLDGWPVNRR